MSAFGSNHQHRIIVLSRLSVVQSAVKDDGFRLIDERALGTILTHFAIQKLI
ncbi:hypothetical protein VCHENC03_4221 [Vibrio sp. HENC-03]|nr:hypothetical protein VCHENC03_4221 [Vibrio sp. HENC-03]